jgi:hypothetical protein
MTGPAATKLGLPTSEIGVSGRFAQLLLLVPIGHTKQPTYAFGTQVYSLLAQLLPLVVVG